MTLPTKPSDLGMIDETFHALNERHNNIYQFVIHYNDYIVSVHDYGVGIPITMIEAHTLTYIEEHPGTTVTELAQYWGKTKGALSQTVTRLTDKGLVEKTKTADNAKNIRLHVTDIGARLSKSHKLYDTVDIAKTMGELRKECSVEEIEAFYKVISVYNKVIKNDFEINKSRKKEKGKTSESE
ncbi:helix-turn-helix domain-containing protein [Clostridium sp. AN503]|uniref:MarR family winged helix-turn-helix transcriptional regulator n=1 Tax=Clostridium sp. AN503 TaxID=3160598 RepID=UPI003459BBCD